MEHTKKTYQDAKQNCKLYFGGHGKLYEPLTWSENQMAYKIAKATDGTVNWWIGQRYTYRVLQTIQMKLILLCVWAEQAVLAIAKTALKFNLNRLTRK